MLRSVVKKVPRTQLRPSVWTGWSPSNNRVKQAQDIEAAIAAGSNGLGVSLADPAAVESAVKAAVAAGIPVITINSGVDLYKELGALTHVGQTEIVAGNGAGERFNALGATKVLCARQEQSNVGLEQRCEGLTETFSGEVVSEFIGLDGDPGEQEATIAAMLAADPDIDAVLGTGPKRAVRAVAAGTTAGVDLFLEALILSTTSSVPSRRATSTSRSISSSTAGLPTIFSVPVQTPTSTPLWVVSRF